MIVRKGVGRTLSAVALMLGFTTTAAAAKDQAPATPKVEFDSKGRVGLSDREMLKRLGLSSKGENAARFDLQVPKAKPTSGTETNVVC